MREPPTPMPGDLKSLWRDQPEELTPSSPELMRHRTTLLFLSTRSEILTSLGASLFFMAVLAWRLGLDLLAGAGLATAAVWILITLYWLRRRVWSSPDQSRFATSGIEFYRIELQHRRRHLMNAWLWHGPLLLACIALSAVVLRTASPGFPRLQPAWPLLLALVVWMVYSVRRRRRQAEEIRRELDEMEDGYGA